MTCSAESGPRPYWLIDYHFPFSYSKDRLNERGFYELDPPQSNPHIIRLIINSTHNNNGTYIKCIDVDVVHETTLIVYGKLVP